MIFDRFFKEDSNELKMRVVNSIPEIQQLKQCEQSPIFHQEGNAYNHTMACVQDAYLSLSYLSKDLEWTLREERIFIMAVLFHDIGKICTTFLKNGDYHSYGHEKKGAQIARRILWDEDFEGREKVCSLIYWHMDRFGLMRDPINKIIEMSYYVDISMLLEVCRCDEYGSKSREESKKIDGLNLIKLMEALSKKLDCYNKPFELSYFGVNDDKLTFKMDRPYKRKPILDIPTVTVLIGLSGCGKDTYINYMDDKDAVVVCRDDIRADFDMCKKGEKIVGTKEQEEMVSKEFNKRLIDAAENGKNIIINNINLKKKYRDNYKELLKGYAYNWNYVYIEAPTLEENNKRHNGQVSMDVLKQMIDNFDFPMISECDNLKIIKQK